ncbi:uncharacterized protein N7515_008722 [Penicillium bovifimosum]|uniref:Polyketide synthase n=1 Tax=Penicillium bovifimosum TaxID=126998 RepID=A0A9W9GNU7_9EURO|nr:uncharacterized protein N7515_008722 [Penicillium bovifimosum]KAJ5124897.1 hypothetical protein N7515_008722 [Penicillium bovifimosum]
MEPAGKILFFGDTSLPLTAALSQLLKSQRRNTLLSKFLISAHEALREGIKNLPQHVRADALRLTSLFDFVNVENQTSHSLRVLSPALLVLVQLGNCISWYENHPHVEFPSSRDSVHIGLCVGQLSAAAVGLSSSLLELVTLAVEVIRVAVRLGSLAFTVGGDLEDDSEGAPWALLVNTDIVSKDDLLSLVATLVTYSPRQQFECSSDIVQDTPAGKCAFITAEFERTVTVQGPPSTLARFRRALLEKAAPANSNQLGRPVPIFAPYHAPHLYTEAEIAGLTEALDTRIAEQQSRSPPQIFSAGNGETYSKGTCREVLTEALTDILIRPIRWKHLCQGAGSSIAKASLSSWEIQCFGPVHTQKALASNLSSALGSSISITDTSISNDGTGVDGGFDTPIAIVGMAGRFPDSDSVEELWQILSNGIDCHKVIPSDRFDPAIYVSKDGKYKNKSATEFGNFMKSPGMFDARFFNMSPREVMQTDPQQRLALVTAYEALEMAGYVPGRTPSTQMERIGTFYGQTTDDYKDVNVVQEIDTYYVSGVVRAFGPGRVSRANQLGGPSVSVDTACASSATALNLACTSIWNNECDTAVVGGMMLLNSPDMYAGLSRGHFVSSDGPCKTFDDEANGYCRGEAVASVVLKRLDAATADNDNILGVILASATNYSAYAASITQPHAGAQETLFRKVLSQAAVQPDEIDYVELHGTGTQLGDAIEMASVLNVLAPESPVRAAERPLYVGSIKANIGHGESASGISALIKTLLLFQKQQIPPHVGIKSGRLNRTFPSLEKRRVRIADRLTPFPAISGRRRKVLINNFGAAGGNSSFILAEGNFADSAPESQKSTVQRDHVISVTAKSDASLQGNLRNLIDYLDKYPETAIEDLAYTTTARKVQHPLRVSVTSSTTSQAKKALSAALQRTVTRPTSKSQDVIFAFTGQGSLSPGVAKQLFETNSTFRSHLTRFERVAVDQGFPPYVEEVIRGAHAFDQLSPVQTQLCHVSIQMALFKMWSSWNIKPRAVIGHSLGEYAAFFAAGVLSASDTLYLVGRRASLLQLKCTSSTHSMLAVNLPMSGIQKIIRERLNNVEVSCLNGPSDVVISGPVASIREAHGLLKASGTSCTMLNVPYAFHSSQIDPILAPFDHELMQVPFSTPRIPILSTLLGRTLQVGEDIGPSYFIRHAREPVQFLDALRTAQNEDIITTNTTFIELGPHPVCLGMIRSTLGLSERLLPSLHRKEDSLATICRSLAALNDQGFSIDWNEYHNSFESTPKLLNLPTYAFDEKRYWIEYQNNWLLQRHEAAASSVPDKSIQKLTTTVQRVVSSTVQGEYATVNFESDLSDPSLHRLIAGHVLNKVALCPSGVFADIALTVADYFRTHFVFPGPVTGMNVVKLEMTSPVLMPVERPAESKMLQIVGEANLASNSIGLRVGILDDRSGALQHHASCQIVFGDSELWAQAWNKNAYLILERMEDLERGVLAGTTSHISHEMVYKLFANVVQYDERYQGMQEVIVDSRKLEAVVSLALYQGADAGTFFCSPLWLDNLAQIAGFIMNAIGTVNPREFTYISHGIESYQIAEEIDPRLPYRAHVRMLPEEKNVFVGDVSIFQGKRMVARCGDVKFKKIPRALIERLLSSSTPQEPSSKRAESGITPRRELKVIQKSIVSKQPSTSSSIDSLRKLLASQIGISEDDLSDDSSFIELGVDSLLSMTILSQIQASLNIELPASAFTDLPTFGDLCNHVLKGLPDQSTGPLLTPGSSTSESDISSPPSLYDIPLESSNDARLLEVYSVIASEIGVDVQEVLTTDDLSVLGLDSMMAISIVGALEDKIGVRLPSDTFESSSKNMHSILSEMFGPSHPSVSQPPIAKDPAANQKESSFPSSILLQGDSSNTKTLFLFPDGSGLASAYAKIPRISSDLRVCGLNSPLLYSAGHTPADIESIAARMVQVMREHQPHGPYLLGGWSAGGLYAFEAARGLLQAGEQVESLILIDSPCRLRYDAMPVSILDLISSKRALSREVRDHFLRTISAVEKYSPRPLPRKACRATLVWAENGLYGQEDACLPTDIDIHNPIVEWLLKRGGELDALGWEELLPGVQLGIKTMQGNHFSMVQDPNAGYLSAAIAEAL